MAAFTSKAAGNWSASGTTTWTQAGVPGSGDTVTISHNITVDVNTTIGASGVTGTTAITFSSSVTGKVLTIATGVTLTLQGDVSMHSSANGTSNITMAAGSTISLLPPSGQQYKLDCTDQNASITISGTTGSHCVVKTDLSGSGLQGYIKVNSANGRDQGVRTATYCDFQNMGTTAIYGIQSSCNNTLSTVTTITNCTFTTSNFTFICGTNAQDGNWTFTDNQFITSVAVTGQSDCCLFLFTGAVTSGVRQCKRNKFDKRVEFQNSPDLIIQYNVFQIAPISTTTWTKAWNSFDRNVIILNGGPNTMWGNVTNNYCAWTVGGDVHGFAVPNALTAFNFTGNIYENTVSGGSGGMIFQGTPTVDQPVNCLNNLILPGPSGKSSGDLLVDLGASVHTKITCEHNTWCGYNPQNGFMVLSGESGTALSVAGTVLSIRANLCWALPNDGGNVGNGVGQDFSTTPTLNVLASPGAGYNGFVNPVTANNTINGSTVALAGYAKYNINNGSIDTTHDVTITTNPFVDRTRNFQGWGTYKGLTTPTVADVVSYITNPANGTQNALIDDLLGWVRAGFAPRNAAFNAASYPGDSSTTDANGNAWPGGAPGIGAMAVVSAIHPRVNWDGGITRIFLGGFNG